MEKPIYKTVLMTFPGGDAEAETRINIPSGNRVFVGATESTNTVQGLIRLGIEENGNVILDAMTTNWHDGKLGSFKQRAIDLGNYKGGSELTLRLTRGDGNTEQCYVEVVFEISQTDNCTY